MTKRIYSIILLLVLMIVPLASSCIEDDFTTNPNDQPTFSVDTLKMGLTFTQWPTPTHSFKVYNPHDKVMSISSIALRDDDEGLFRLNVDGIGGVTFNNVEIRPNDSIFVFVEATLPQNGSALPVNLKRHIDFITNGVAQTVVLSIDGQDVERRTGIVIDRDTRWNANLPYQVFDSLIVAKGATLTLDAGVTLHFHDKAFMRVDGTLRCEGTVEKPINFTGDRTDDILSDTPYDLMSGQWEGIRFTSSSRNNHISHTSIRNTHYGVIVDSVGATEKPAIYLLNSQLRNSIGSVFTVSHADVVAVGCEFAEAGSNVVNLRGGNHIFNHCTFANYYLFAATGGTLIMLSHLDENSDDLSGQPYTSADITNCILYGNSTELSHGDLIGTNIYLRRCLLRSAGTDDENFIDCIWDADPLYYTVRNEYIFDYRLKDESPAIGAANPALTRPDATIDFYGLSRGSAPDLGAYVYTPSTPTP
ncbi:MAG: hypothetical protein IJC40_02135 [Muribaculaceae bacterium]|nr:hypothetical protein [Muribaculaceae bacterium]